ncbi:MAG: hypothetical protein MOB07_03305, partial [Acidobacteria bacterium]|nr:hypothetical protein [Acidobacteriota bacterium]
MSGGSGLAFTLKLVLLLAACVCCLPERSIDFNRDIRPILADKCWVCHGPDAPNKKIKLRLDSKEYYQFYAYFNSIPEDGRASNYGNSPPWMAAPTSEQKSRYDELKNDIAQTERRLESLARNNQLLQRRWERSLGRSSNTHWFPSDNLLWQHALDEGSAPTIKDSIARIDPAKPDEDKVTRREERGERREERGAESGFKFSAPKYGAAPTGHGVEFNGNILFDAGKIADFNFRDRLKDYKDVFTITASPAVIIVSATRQKQEPQIFTDAADQRRLSVTIRSI